MPRASLLLTAPLVAALLAGCGGASASKSAGDFKGDQRAVAQVVDDLSSAASKRDAKKICNDVFTTDLAKRLVRGSDQCKDLVADQLKDADVYKMTIESVQITGARATASVKSQVNGDDKLTTLSFARQGREWRLAGLGS